MKRSDSRGPRGEKPKSEFDQKTLDLRRVARVMGGGRRFSFRVTLALGDRKGRVGIGTAKGQDVALAMDKASRQARKNMVRIHLDSGTIPHEVSCKFKSASIMLRPTKLGTGIIAGGAVRTVCDLAGIRNISGKIISKSTNKINNALATVGALQKLKPAKVKTAATVAPKVKTEKI